MSGNISAKANELKSVKDTEDSMDDFIYFHLSKIKSETRVLCHFHIGWGQEYKIKLRVTVISLLITITQKIQINGKYQALYGMQGSFNTYFTPRVRCSYL